MHPFYLAVLLLLLSGFASPQNAPSAPPYNYTDLVLLACGAQDGNQTGNDGRIWEPDSGSKFFSLDNDDNKLSLSAKPAMGSSASDKTYYEKARVSLSNFTYTFPVSAAGPMFLRLYFYPETYSGYTKSSSFFSVVANGYTLMSNFSAFLHLNLTRNIYSVSKEFVVCAGEDKHVNVTFIPNLNSYAFVNAIEVVSMPTDLYYGRDYKNFSIINDPNNQFSLPNTTSLETLYRLNVGGNVVSPPDDTGMFRTWGDDTDFVMTVPYFVALPPANLSVRYLKKETPKYMAPETVYRHARLMGGDDQKNNRYRNLSWSFKVDSEFDYLVRLHFCETQPEVTAPKQRVFAVYIDNKTAEPVADVMNMAGSRGIPVHRDYVVFVSSGNRDHTKDLWLSLHPLVDEVNNPTFYDVILNGVEIIKISGSDRTLAGFNPEPPAPTETPAQHSGPPHNQSYAPIFAISIGVVGLVLVSVLAFLLFRRRRRDHHSGSKQGTTSWDPFSTTWTKSTKSRGSSLPSDLCRHFSLSDIKAATNDFDQLFIIGAGGFGNVYKGLIDDGSTPVAIKRLNPGSKQGAHEFLTEIEMLSRLRHLHLVSLIGFCEDDDEMILVYDYMSRGTLRDHLYNTDNPPLPWNQRLEICIGAARGLHYLHTGAKHTIIHRDVKTTNILLDEKWVAKVSDFGLSRVGSTSVSKAHVTTVVKGSFGYLDPEYYKRQHLTEKSDVYSFGVVLCEVICAKPALNREGDKKQAMLAEWARSSYRRGTFDEMIDEKLKGKIAAESLKKYGEIVMQCLGENGNERPSMNDVVWSLEFVLQLQRTAEEGTKMKGEEEEMEVEIGRDSGSFSVTTEEISSGVWTSGSGEKPLMG